MGTLYIVATPVGNLKDITLRALEVLRGAALVVCEDTRVTYKLLAHYKISKPLVSYFQHSKLSKAGYIVEQLAQGKNVALVTDAGTPGISDPGNKLIEQVLHFLPLDEGRAGWGVEDIRIAQIHANCAHANNTTPSQSPPQLRGRGNGVKIVPLPGPNAAIAALSISGLPADKFIFLGFPPHKKGRQKFFQEVAEAKYTVVFYESTHRILRTLNELNNKFQVSCSKLRKLVVCRELTKQFESIYRGTAQEILKVLESDKNNQKGEFVVVVSNG